MVDKRDTPPLRDELRATLRARQELGEEMEEEVIESFLARLQRSIDERVDRRVADALRHNKRRASPSTGRIAVILVLSIPLVAIAGAFADLYGILVVAAVDLVLLLRS